MLNRIDGPATGDVIISPTAGVVYYMLHRRGRFDGGVLVTNGAVICREGGWESSGWLGMRSSALLEDASRSTSPTKSSASSARASRPPSARSAPSEIRAIANEVGIDSPINETEFDHRRASRRSPRFYGHAMHVELVM